MKRKIFLSVISVVFCMFVFAAVCSADVSGDYTYTVTDGKATITGYSGAGGTTVYIPDNLGGYPVVAIGDRAFAGNTVIKIPSVPASVTVIGKGAFADCDAMISVILNEGLLTIDDGAFSDCSTLGSVTIPASVTYIGNDAFAFCEKLSNLSVKSGSTSFASSNYALFTKDMTRMLQFPIGRAALKNFTVPDGVTAIDENAFYGAKSLVSITLPDSLRDMSSEIFVNCPALNNITVGAGNTKFSSADGNLFNKAGTLLIQYAAGKTDESYTVPSGVTAIDTWAFGSCDNLKSVSVPNTVKEIGYAAFANCEGLTAITIPGTTTVGELAFGGCTALESVVMNEGVVSIGMSAFSGCSALSDITIPASVTTIGGMNLGTGKYVGAFGNCPSIENFTVAAENAYFSSVNSSLFNKSATELIKYATGKADTAYALPATVTSIAAEAFAGAASLETVILPGTLKTIGDDAFRATGLTKVNIPEGVTYIGLYAFADCADLAEANISSTVNFIGAYSFSGCEELKGVKVETQTPVMGTNIFRGADNDLVVRCHLGSSVAEYALSNGITVKDAVYEPTVTVVNKSVGVTVNAPVGGWNEGTNTFTVTSETPCAVIVSYDGGKSYTRLKATAQPTGSYSFTADNVADGVIFRVTYMGDINGDGKFTNADVTRIKAANLGKYTLDAVGACLADVNKDGKFTNADVTRLIAMNLGKYQPKW